MTTMNNNQMTTTMPTPISDSKLDIKKNQEQEIKEALDVTNTALEHVCKSIKYIKGASEWGFLDLVCGGGCISSMVKHDNIDKASHEMKLANESIKKLNKELDDVEELSIEIKGSTIFFDIFFDNIFSDMSVQSKIADAENKCHKARRELEHIKKELNERLKQCQNPGSVDPSGKDKAVVFKSRMDIEKELNEAFEASNVATVKLEKALRAIKKASEVNAEDNTFLFGSIGFMFSDNYILKVRIKMREATDALKDLNKKIAGIEGIDDTMTTDFKKFKEIYQDISDCENILFDKVNGKAKFAEANKYCLGSMSQVEAIRKILKDRLVPYQ